MGIPSLLKLLEGSVAALLLPAPELPEAALLPVEPLEPLEPEHPAKDPRIIARAARPEMVFFTEIQLLCYFLKNIS
jgi:hypothetical protein